MAKPAGRKKLNGAHMLVLCGSSVLMEGIEASLRGRAGLKTTLLDTSQPDADKVLDRLCPDIILFDLTPSLLSCVFAFLRTHTRAILIGLDIESGQALFLSGEWRMLPTVADLVQVIEARTQEIHSKQL